MFVFKMEKMPFTGCHCAPESYPLFTLEFQHKEEFEGKKIFYKDSGGRNVF